MIWIKVGDLYRRSRWSKPVLYCLDSIGAPLYWSMNDLDSQRTMLEVCCECVWCACRYDVVCYISGLSKWIRDGIHHFVSWPTAKDSLKRFCSQMAGGIRSDTTPNHSTATMSAVESASQVPTRGCFTSPRVSVGSNPALANFTMPIGHKRDIGIDADQGERKRFRGENSHLQEQANSRKRLVYPDTKQVRSTWCWGSLAVPDPRSFLPFRLEIIALLQNLVLL